MNFKHYYRSIGAHGFFKGLIGEVVGKKSLYTVHPPNSQFPLKLRVPSSDVGVFLKIFKKTEYDFNTNETPKVIIDAGANVGLSTAYFATRFPEAQVIAIEPEKDNFDLLLENTSMFKNVVAIRAALWSTQTQISLIDPGTGSWSFRTRKTSSSSERDSKATSTVDTITIDQIISDYSLHKIDILKIDIEGAEAEVFKDSSSWINKVRSLIIELHERHWPGSNRIFYYGTPGFDKEWVRGENHYLSKDDFLTEA